MKLTSDFQCMWCNEIMTPADGRVLRNTSGTALVLKDGKIHFFVDPKVSRQSEKRPINSTETDQFVDAVLSLEPEFDGEENDVAEEN